MLALPAQSRSISPLAWTAPAWFCVYGQRPKAATCPIDGEPSSQRMTPANHSAWAVLEETGHTVTSSREQSEGWRDQPDQFKPGVPTAHVTAISASCPLSGRLQHVATSGTTFSDILTRSLSLHSDLDSHPTPLDSV